MSTGKTVSLLPEWYRKELRQRMRLRRHLAFLVLLGGALVGVGHLCQRHVTRLRTEHAALARQASMLRDLDPEIAAKRQEIDRLAERQQAVRELGATVPMSKLTQQILNDMTPGMLLSRFLVEVRSEAVKGSGFVGDRQNPPKYHNVAHLTLVGMAPQDQPANALYSKLSENPLFTDVTMTYLRREILLGYEVRRFELQMTMNLDRLSMETPVVNENKPERAKAAAGPAQGPAAMQAPVEVSHGS